MMKTLEYYMNLPYRLEIIPDADEGGFVASYPELRGCLTCGDTIESVAANAEDCKRAWLVAAMEDNLEIAEVVPLARELFQWLQAQTFAKLVNLPNGETEAGE